MQQDPAYNPAYTREEPLPYPGGLYGEARAAMEQAIKSPQVKFSTGGWRTIFPPAGTVPPPSGPQTPHDQLIDQFDQHNLQELSEIQLEPGDLPQPLTAEEQRTPDHSIAP